MLPVHFLQAQGLPSIPPLLALEAYRPVSTTPWGAAAPGVVNTHSAVAMMHERRFGVRLLDRFDAAANLALEASNVFARMHYSGAASWQSVGVALGYGRSFNLFGLGAEVQYGQWGGKGERLRNITSRVGVGGALSKELQWRVSFQSPEALLVSTEGAKPWSISTGIGWQPGLPLLIALEAEGARSGLHLRTAIFYRPHPLFQFSLGYGSDDRALLAGAGYRFGQLLLQVQASRHPYLGWSPLVSIGWQQNEKL